MTIPSSVMPLSQRQSNDSKSKLNQHFLAARMILKFRKIIAQTVILIYSWNWMNPTSAISSQMQFVWSIHDNGGRLPDNPVDVSVISNGVIRDPIVKGKTGLRSSSVTHYVPFRWESGLDEAGTMGYPLISFYLYPARVQRNPWKF